MAEEIKTELMASNTRLAPVIYAQDLMQVKSLARLAASSRGGRTEDHEVAILIGQELGIPPMQAIEHIYMVSVQGSVKPQISADMLAAMVRKSGKCTSLKHMFRGEPNTDSRTCIVKGKRSDGDKDVCEVSYNRTMSANARSGKSPTWKFHLDAMLYARAMSLVCKRNWPEIVCGMQAVAVSDSGAAIVDWEEVEEEAAAEVKETEVQGFAVKRPEAEVPVREILTPEPEEAEETEETPEKPVAPWD